MHENLIFLFYKHLVTLVCSYYKMIPFEIRRFLCGCLIGKLFCNPIVTSLVSQYRWFTCWSYTSWFCKLCLRIMIESCPTLSYRKELRGWRMSINKTRCTSVEVYTKTHSSCQWRVDENRVPGVNQNIPSVKRVALGYSRF